MTKRKGRGFTGQRGEKEKIQYESIASDAKGPGPQRCMPSRHRCVWVRVYASPFCHTRTMYMHISRV